MTTESATRPARERLLAAAGELFYEQGIAATGVDAVLARAGVSPSTLYAHFAGKDALVAAYLERRHRMWVQTWDEVLDGRTDPAERLLSVLDALALYRAREGSRRGCAFLAAATELPAGHPARAWLDADSHLLAGRLRELATATGLDDADAEDLADALLLLYDGALARWARDATVADLAQGDPLARARGLAADLLAARLPTRS